MSPFIATPVTVSPLIPKLRLLPGSAGRPKVLEYLSASRLKTWQTCRRQFFFRYVQRIQTPTAPALFIGQQVHEVLRLYNWSRWKQELIDTDELRSEFEFNWEQGLAESDVRWKKTGDEATAKAQALAMVETYLDESPTPRAEMPEGVEVEVECHLDHFDLKLVGIIDLIRPSGVIVDYKTAARAPSASAGTQQHATQLACYALLYRESTGCQESGFELHYLIKTKRPKVLISKHPPMSQQLESDLYQLVDDYLEGISAERWIPSPGQHCSWCDYARECRKLSGL